MRLTRKELAAAIRAARQYPPGFGMRWGCRGYMFTFDPFMDHPPPDWDGG